MPHQAAPAREPNMARSHQAAPALEPAAQMCKDVADDKRSELPIGDLDCCQCLLRCGRSGGPLLDVAVED